jgi:single stranded DNA-binding protein
MAMAINSATVIGNLGGDPQTRSLPSGDSVANFSLATTERFKDRNGERQERTIVVSNNCAIRIIGASKVGRVFKERTNTRETLDRRFR